MKADKIPQETPIDQAPLENEPVYKSFLNQKGSFLLILGLVIIILVVLGIGGYYLVFQNLLYKNTDQSQQQAPNSLTSKDFSTNTIENLPSELKNIPIYPNSQFKKKEDYFNTLRCLDRHLCKKSYYELTTKDSLDQVLAWYRSLSGWKFTESKNLSTLPSIRIDDSSLTKNSKTINFDISSSDMNGFTLLGELGIEYYIPGEDFSWPSVSQSEVANWTEYKSPNNLLSFKYPKEWINEGGNLYLQPDCDQCGGVRSYFSVRTIPNKSLTSEEFVKNKYKITTPKTGPETIIINKPAIFNGVDAAVVATIPGAGTPGPNAYIVKGDKIIEIESDGVELETLSKILSTFKFTN